MFKHKNVQSFAMAELLRCVNMTYYLLVSVSGSGNTANISICCSHKNKHTK